MGFLIGLVVIVAGLAFYGVLLAWFWISGVSPLLRIRARRREAKTRARLIAEYEARRRAGTPDLLDHVSDAMVNTRRVWRALNRRLDDAMFPELRDFEPQQAQKKTPRPPKGPRGHLNI